MGDAVRVPPRELVTEILGRKMTREIWTSNYDKVLPVSVQDFDLSAVLPAVFYMFRFGRRRGPGQFVKTFGPSEGTPTQRKKGTTVQRVASTLARADNARFVEVGDDVGQAILGDLLLCYCLENRKYELGRSKPVQRVAPTHYMASWIDLPDRSGHLRFVPEMIVAILANQKKSAHVQETTSGGKRTWFPLVVGCDNDIFADNALLVAASQGMLPGATVGDLAADRFDEEAEVGIDQLLTIRIAQTLESAPGPTKGKDASKIPNRRPIATKASRAFSEDIRKFVREYAHIVPRHAFMEMMESCMAVGMTSILSSVVEVVLEWEETGDALTDRTPAPVFVDSSMGADRDLRNVAEQSMDDYVRRLERFPVALMALRLLDYRARNNRAVRKRHAVDDLISAPVAQEWIAFLGEILHDRCEEAEKIQRSLADLGDDLAEEAAMKGYPDISDILRDNDTQPNPVRRLAEALAALHDRTLRRDLHKLVDSVLHAERPNGLATKRQVSRRVPGAGTKRRPVRAFVFTDTVLEYLVHRHVLPSGSGNKPRVLSFVQFVRILRSRYGFCVDEAPPGLTVSNELLQRNRSCLERRLRDLGLLVGVNDAEKMKRLHPRFKAAL